MEGASRPPVPGRPEFHHNRLVVYRKSIEFVAAAARVIPAIPQAQTHLRDQLARAATSIALNVAEGSGEFKGAEKARFYRMARRSASECAAVLEVLEVVGYPDVRRLDGGRDLLNEIMAMLTTMSKRLDSQSNPRVGNRLRSVSPEAHGIARQSDPGP